jgi:hypothetical protein
MTSTAPATGGTMPVPAPRVEFFSHYEGAPLPQPASTDAMGTLPVRAAQHCLPLKAASGNGFYLYPPFDFAVRWDGTRSSFTWLGADGEPEGWRSMENNAIFYHPSAAAARASVPADRAAEVDEVLDAEGHSFINADPRSPNTIEITTGLVVRTERGWISVVRSVANWASPRPYLVLDGAIETDWYRTDIPVTIRLPQPGEVRFSRSLPMAQLQVVPLASLRPEHTNADHPTGIAHWPEDVWREYVASARPRHTATHMGTYVAASRRAAANGRCPYPHEARE